MPARTTLLVTTLTLLLFAGVTAPPATAAWSVPGAGPALAAAARLPSADPPAVSATGPAAGRTFTLSWPAIVLAGQPVTGYLIRRASSLLGTGAVSAGTCLGTVVTLGGTTAAEYVPADPADAQQSCTDQASVQLGAVTYSIAPVLGSWIGPASAFSAPVS